MNEELDMKIRVLVTEVMNSAPQAPSLLELESREARANTIDLARPDKPLDHVALPRRRSHRWSMVTAAAVVIAVAVIMFSGIGNHPVGHHILANNSPVVPSPSPSEVIPTHPGGQRPAPEPPPCPKGLTVPTIISGRYCGPVPPAGNGLGSDGVCTGQETTVPCGAWVTIGHYYAYTVPGQCDGLVIFDGRTWVSELPPPTPGPDTYVWMRINEDGTVGYISPTGDVGFTLYTGQALHECSASTTTTPT